MDALSQECNDVIHTTIQVEYHLCDDIKMKTPHASKRVNEMIDIYATLYSKEPVGLDKANDGWRKENIARTSEQINTKHSISRDRNPKE